MKEPAFRLKAHFFPLTVMKLLRCDQRSILQQLKELHRSAPNYFQQTPVIIDVTELKRPPKGLDLAKLTQLLREYQLIPVAVQGLVGEEIESAQSLGLALWRSQTQTAMEKTAEPVSPPPAEVSNMIITKPVRSGTRIYAKQTNLVLLAPVSSGAECIADGDIFCYAPVRGRLLAGASGNLQSQIFCHSLEAELIAIAGYYLLYDEYPIQKSGYFQILLKENKLQVHNFSASASVERSVLLCQK
jgi:septum site-determining protein MinC